MVSQLHRFWERHMASARGEPNTGAGKDWVADNTLLAGLRIGLRETYDHLLNSQPTFAEFERWVIEKNDGAIDARRLDRLRAASADSGQPADPDAEPVLSVADLGFWDQHGYVILRDAVPPENCQAA